MVVPLLVAALPTGAAPSGTGSISGRVVDADGQPVSGISAQVENGPQVQTDALGTYTIPDLDAGSYKVGFTDCNATPKYVEQWYSGHPDTTSADAVVVMDGMATPLGDVTLAEGVTVTGNVTDTNGAPLLRHHGQPLAHEPGSYQDRRPDRRQRRLHDRADDARQLQGGVRRPVAEPGVGDAVLEAGAVVQHRGHADAEHRQQSGAGRERSPDGRGDDRRDRARSRGRRADPGSASTPTRRRTTGPTGSPARSRTRTAATRSGTSPPPTSGCTSATARAGPTSTSGTRVPTTTLRRRSYWPQGTTGRASTRSWRRARLSRGS